MKTPKQPIYKFLVRKYVYASNIGEAYKLDRTTGADSIVKQEQEPVRTEAIGYMIDED